MAEHTRALAPIGGDREPRSILDDPAAAAGFDIDAMLSELAGMVAEPMPLDRRGEVAIELIRALSTLRRPGDPDRRRFPLAEHFWTVHVGRLTSRGEEVRYPQPGMYATEEAARAALAGGLAAAWAAAFVAVVRCPFDPEHREVEVARLDHTDELPLSVVAGGR